MLSITLFHKLALNKRFFRKLCKVHPLVIISKHKKALLDVKVHDNVFNSHEHVQIPSIL